jgi:transposase-like protein
MSAALRPVGPRAGVDYPTSRSQFVDWFGSDADCARYLARVRWSDGFSCPKCDHDKWWPSKRRLYVCAACGRQTSLTAGTIFDSTRLPLLTWFRAAWMVSSSKSGGSAKELQRELGIGYHAAWLLLQKLRLAMVRPGRGQYKLTGDIEVDESYLGGPTPGGKRGRGAEGKVFIAIAVERKGFGKNSKRRKLRRTRIEVVPDVKAKTLLDFVEDTCEQGSTIYTDGLAAYKNLPSPTTTPTPCRRAAILLTSCSRRRIASPPRICSSAASRPRSRPPLRSRQPVHLARLWRHASRLGPGRENGVTR